MGMPGSCSVPGWRDGRPCIGAGIYLRLRLRRMVVDIEPARLKKFNKRQGVPVER